MKNNFLKNLLIVLLFVGSNIKILAQCYSKISVNQWVSATVRVDGTLWTWGNNSDGQLGDGTTTSKDIPTQIGSSTLWQEISINYSHTLGIRNGRLLAWGNNTSGQLGDGTFVKKLVPTQIGTATNWDKVSAGDNHSVAIRENGTIWAFGDNDFGQLGTGNFLASNVPLQIGNETNWAKVVTGLRRTIALKTDGTLWCWGQNTPTGTNISVNSNVPLQIGTLNEWKDISLSYEHILLLKTNNTIWGWGQNNFGALGNGNTVNFFGLPQQLDPGTTWKTIAAGRDFSTATKQNGTLWAWGLNNNGQFGNNSTTNSTTPVQIGTATNWRNTYSSYNHTIAQKIMNDQIWVWGFNIFGQLGNGNTTDISTPLALGTCTTLNNENFTSISDTFSIFPNPTTTYINVIVNNGTEINELRITDLFGKLLSRKVINFNKVDVSDLQAGIYLIQIETSKNSIEVLKFIKI